MLHGVAHAADGDQRAVAGGGDQRIVRRERDGAFGQLELLAVFGEGGLQYRERDERVGAIGIEREGAVGGGERGVVRGVAGRVAVAGQKDRARHGECGPGLREVGRARDRLLQQRFGAPRVVFGEFLHHRARAQIEVVGDGIDLRRRRVCGAAGLAASATATWPAIVSWT